MTPWAFAWGRPWWPRRVRCEQAVYGSFPFWSRGYSVLAKSAGCRPEWALKLREACQKYGEPPQGASSIGGTFSLVLPDGVRMVVRAYSPGNDDRGRPNAMAFHALFLRPGEARKVLCPLDLEVGLRDDWGPEAIDQELRPLALAVPSGAEGAGPRGAAIAHEIKRGRHVYWESPGPIDALVRATWAALSRGARRRASFATRAYSTGNAFDLVGLPKRPSVVDAKLVDGATLVAPSTEAAPPWGRRRALLAAGLAGLAAIVAGTFPLWGRPSRTRSAPVVPLGPPRAPYEAVATRERTAQRCLEALISLADEFGAPLPESPTSGEAVAAILEGLKYQGPLASSDEGPLGPWHQHVVKFARPRVLPPGLANGPVRWQVAVLADGFGLPVPSPEEADERAVEKVAAALRRPFAVDRSAVEGPVAESYAAFLETLPRSR